MNKKKSDKKISIPIVNDDGKLNGNLEITTETTWISKPHFEVLHKSGNGSKAKFWIIHRFSLEGYTKDDYAIEVTEPQAMSWMRKNRYQVKGSLETLIETTVNIQSLNRYNDIGTEEQFDRVASAKQLSEYSGINLNTLKARLRRYRQPNSKKPPKHPHVRLDDPDGGGNGTEQYWRIKEIKHLLY